MGGVNKEEGGGPNGDPHFQGAGGRGQGLAIRKAPIVGQTAQIQVQTLFPIICVTLRALIAWASIHILNCKVSVMTSPAQSCCELVPVRY